MIQLDLSDHRPIYEQIKEKFIQLIVTGVLAEHDKIPSVRELAGILTINPNTIQRAYRDLEAEGYIYSQKARGSFVSPKAIVKERADTEGILEEIRELSKKAAFLGVDQGTLMSEIEKVYSKEV